VVQTVLHEGMEPSSIPHFAFQAKTFCGSGSYFYVTQYNTVSSDRATYS